MNEITVIGGGVAGLTAAITCAEHGAAVRLVEAHGTVGGRARSTDGGYKANLGPHAIYKGGILWDWLSERDLMPPLARPRLTGYRFHYEGAIHRTPPLTLIPPGLRLRGRMAPVDQDFRSWVTDHSDGRTADLLSGAGRCLHLPSRSRTSSRRRSSGSVRSGCCSVASPPARFIVGGWNVLIDRLERRARSLGVAIVTGERVEAVPDPPVIVALELCDARRLLGDESLEWPSGSTVCLDIGVREHGGDPWILSDLETAGWVERYSAQDPSLAPRRRAPRPSTNADPTGREHRRRRRCASSDCSTSSFEDWRGRVDLAAASGHGRPQRCAGPSRHNLA